MIARATHQCAVRSCPLTDVFKQESSTETQSSCLNCAQKIIYQCHLMNPCLVTHIEMTPRELTGAV